jgi:hypothetical protein
MSPRDSGHHHPFFKQPALRPTPHSRDPPSLLPLPLPSPLLLRPQVKVSSDKAIYRLVGIDLFRTDQKAFHLARLVGLPPARDPVMVGDTPLPPLLVFNVQMPQYPAAFWGASDGPGQSIVYYFALPEVGAGVGTCVWGRVCVRVCVYVCVCVYE